MEVQGVDPDLLNEVKNASIIDGNVDASGNLVLTTQGGVNKNAGSVVKPLFSWPVGSIYIGVTSTSPAELFGGGTWERFGQGKVLVSQDPSDATFNQPLAVGGEKAVALTNPNQNAPHSHGVNDPGHAHNGGAYDPIFGGVAGEANFAGPANTEPNYTGISIQSSGGGATHNNLQPYIVVYMWRRTA